MFHNILVAVDVSPEAEQALTQAIDLAESEHSRLTLITGVHKPPLIAYSRLNGDVLLKLDADARAWSDEILRRARDRIPDEIPVTTIVTEQPIRPALIEQIHRGRYDLIVMGSRGRGAVRATMLGSVSHYVLNHSPIPVLIVHADRDQSSGAISREIGTSNTVGTSRPQAFTAARLMASRSSTRAASQP